MKKILLGTTTLIGAASLLGGAAFAETPKVTIGGVADFQLGWVNEDLDSTLRSHAFRSDTTLMFRVDAKSDAGLGYGGGVDLRADATADPRGSGTDASRTFIYLDGSNWGRFEMGSEVGAQGTMKVDASSIARATGGIDGDWVYFVTPATTGQFWVTPDLDLGHGTFAAGTLGSDSQENLNKVTYYSPRWAGFQLGVSYMSSTAAAERGQTISRSDVTAGEAENVWTGGISYEGKFDQVGIALAATGEHGSSELATTNDLRTWNLGGKLSYMGFALAGSYGSIGDSLQLTATSSDSTHYWTLGGAYEMGPFGASVTWMNSTHGVAATADDDFSNLSFGVDYKLAPGLTPYAELNWIQQDTATATSDNDSTVFIAGTQLSF